MNPILDAFNADLAKLNAELHRLGAIMEPDADGFVGIDATKAPAELLDCYNRLLQFGYAMGYVPA